MKAALKTLFSEKQWNNFKEEAHLKRLALVTKDSLENEISSSSLGEDEINTAKALNKDQYQSASSSSSRKRTHPNIREN